METNIVKLEMDVCKGCLSADRNLKPLSRDCAQLYYKILGDEYLLSEKSMYFNLNLCWECISMLRRILIYQKRFRRSQIVLSKKMEAIDGIKSLSQLTTYHKNDYDLTQEHIEQQSKDIKIKLDKSKNEELNSEIKGRDQRNGEMEMREENCNDFVEDIPQVDDIEEDINKEKDADLKINYYNEKLCERNLKTSLVNYDDGPEGHVDNVSLKFEQVKDVMKKGRKKSRNNVLFKTYIYFLRQMNAMNMDLKQEVDAEGVKCSYCEKYMSNRILLKKHWNEHTIDVLKCVYCDIMSIKKGEMLHHLRGSHKYNLLCECGFECRSRKDYYIHYNKYHRQFVCDHCQSRFKDKGKLEKHIVNNHLPYKCDLCNRIYKKKHTLKVHYLAIHKEMSERTDELTYCVECDIHFENTFLYKRHLRTAVAHNPKRPAKVPCPDCGKIFSRRSYMVNHYDLIHKQKSKYYCEICDKYFSCGYGMRTHKKFVHLKEEKPRHKLCKICGKGFYTNRELNNHTRTHTGERPFQCGFCEAAFAQDTSRKTHERTQHKDVRKCANKVE